MSIKKINILVILYLLIIFKCTAFCTTKKNSLRVEDEVTVKNISEFGVFPQLTSNESDQQKYQRYLKLQQAFAFAIKNKVDLFFPKGIYDVGERNFPFREPDLETTHLLDCGGITIFGEGRGTILKTSSRRGADVLQLNMVKNLTIKKFDITADLYSYTESGSNGVSITNGYDNILLDDLYIYNLPGISREGYIDGGKGLTMQFAANKASVKGYLKATNIKVVNSAYGFRFDAVNVSDLLKEKINIELQINVDKAYQGFSMDFGGASEKVNPSSKLLVKVHGTLKNCQQYIRFSRVIGGNYNFNLDRTESYAEVLKDNKGKPWTPIDIMVFGFLSNYSKAADINITGNVGEVDNKILIGAVGSIEEPYNLKNRTENSVFNFDISGKSRKGDFHVFDYKGESVHDSKFKISRRTINNGKIPAQFNKNNNRVELK